MPAIAYCLLQKAITHKYGTHSLLAQALGSERQSRSREPCRAAPMLLDFDNRRETRLLSKGPFEVI
jgi:hypothetical protein